MIEIKILNGEYDYLESDWIESIKCEGSKIFIIFWDGDVLRHERITSLQSLI